MERKGGMFSNFMSKSKKFFTESKKAVSDATANISDKYSQFKRVSALTLVVDRYNVACL